ncbi:condensation domain-containing protein, partial [Jeotgalicoccus sp. S0W5]|uniref:condensation domain-containing protein n=1 Tax=Jeotgalicoccus sp. S0W5 TaxID=2527874 RepID=UPI001F0E3231
MDRVGLNDNFFELGGHSLKAIQLVSGIHRVLNIDIPVRTVFDSPTVRELADTLESQGKTESKKVRPIKKQPYYPLSSAQKRMYVLQKMDKDSTHYNMPSAFELKGQLDYKKLESAIRKLISHHEILRTSFETRDGEPVQKINTEINFSLTVEEKGKKADYNISDFIRPFDLEGKSLLRAKLIKSDAATHIFLIDTHHIVSDGISTSIILNDLSKLYNEVALEELNIHYKDFSVWEQEQLDTENYKKQEDYWLDAFSNLPSTLDLPTDFSRPEVQNFEGHHFEFKLDSSTSQGIKELAANTGTTMYMILLSAYNILLHKYTNQSDILVGTPVAGRSHQDIQSMVGMFVNTLVMRNRPEDRKKVTDFIHEVKHTSITAYDHADYPFEVLIEKLLLERDSSRNPLFQTMFTVQNFTEDTLNFEGLKISPQPIDFNISKFDLTMSIQENIDSIDCHIEYASALFKEETINRMSKHFTQILEEIIKNPERSISEINMLT